MKEKVIQAYKRLKKYKCNYNKFIQMQKLEIFLTIVIGLISGIAMLSSQESYAQQNASLSANFSEILSRIKELCPSEVPPPCPNHLSVNVLYQDGSTVALESRFDLNSIWKAVAEVKKYGYKIDGITSYRPLSQTTILVVMSK